MTRTGASAAATRASEAETRTAAEEVEVAGVVVVGVAEARTLTVAVEGPAVVEAEAMAEEEGAVGREATSLSTMWGRAADATTPREASRTMTTMCLVVEDTMRRFRLSEARGAMGVCLMGSEIPSLLIIYYAVMDKGIAWCSKRWTLPLPAYESGVRNGMLPGAWLVNGNSQQRFLLFRSVSLIFMSKSGGCTCSILMKGRGGSTFQHCFHFSILHINLLMAQKRASVHIPFFCMIHMHTILHSMNPVIAETAQGVRDPAISPFSQPLQMHYYSRKVSFKGEMSEVR